MKKLVVALLVALAAGGWLAVPASASGIEKFPDTEPGSKLVLLLNTDTVVVKAIRDDGNAYLMAVAVVDAKGEPTGAGWFGVHDKDCEAGGGAAVLFADKDMAEMTGVFQWGHDPSNVFTKVAKRVCELGRSKAGI